MLLFMRGTALVTALSLAPVFPGVAWSDPVPATTVEASSTVAEEANADAPKQETKDPAADTNAVSPAGEKLASTDAATSEKLTKDEQTPAKSDVQPAESKPADQQVTPGTAREKPVADTTGGAAPERPVNSADASKTLLAENPVQELLSEPGISAEKLLAVEEPLAANRQPREPIQFITDVKYFTPNRPSWLEMPPSYDDAANTLRVAVKAGPHPRVRDCEPDLEREVSTAVAEFVNEHLKSPYASTVINYSLDELRRKKVVREQFSEQLGTSIGLMNQVHAQLVFDDNFQDEIEQRWSEITAASRLAQTGLGAGVVLLLLSTLFSYFKVDTATKGYYTGRLQFATAGTILALVAASVLLAKCIPWM